MRTTMWCVLIALCSSSVFAADTIVPPNIKTGLWEITETHTMTGMPSMPAIPPEALANMSPEQGVEAGRAALDAHSMDPVKVLAFASTLGARPIHTLLVGCEPTTFGDGGDYTEMQMGLSEPVLAAVDEAVKMIDALIEELLKATPVL